MAPGRTAGSAPDEAWSPQASTASTDISLPGYRDFALVARGGDSLVYRASQDGLDRPVAVKVMLLDADGAEGRATLTRFQRELEITVRLGRAHPHIVTVLDTQVTGGGQPCIVMEFYDLGSLHDQLRAHGPLPPSAVVHAGTVVADALAYAHGQGVLHRDVKPQNILVLPTSYVLADFGLARRVDAGHSASLERFSYRHAAPQVLDGEVPTVADDVYSLGSTLFTLLDGRPPFAADDPEEDTALAYLRRARTEQPRPIRDVGAPPELLAIVDRCLTKAREDRFPDAESLRTALAAVVTEARAWAPGTALPAPVAPEPAPADEPMPVAPSALGHVAGTAIADPVAADAEPTGHRVDEPAVIRPTEPAETDEPTETDGKPPWRRIAVFAGIALLVGALLGLAGTWLRVPGSANRGAAPATTMGLQPIPTFTATVASPTSVQVNDPRLAPDITKLDDHGTSITLHWTDRSNGEAVFVIVQVDVSPTINKGWVGRGQTTAVVEGLDPSAARYCFQIVAIIGTKASASQQRCTGTRR
jgi:eukaryotic-like serine/threonine-protein kinase